MALRGGSSHLETCKTQLTERLRTLRLELFGDHGGPEMARNLGLPARSWYNYETGVTVPGHILSVIAERTEVNPLWLLTGCGPVLRPRDDPPQE